MEVLTEAARKARAEYVKKYREAETEDQREKRREYAREWRKKNPDKVKAARIRYWNRRADKIREQQAEGI